MKTFYPTLVDGKPETNAARRSEVVLFIDLLEVENDADEQRMIALFEELNDLAHSSMTDSDREMFSMMLATGGMRYRGARHATDQLARRAANHFMRPVTMQPDGDGFWLLTIVYG